ncbi:MAG: hypothetical protein ACRDDZ_05865 [Marinifilaceae bacterium]
MSRMFSLSALDKEMKGECGVNGAMHYKFLSQHMLKINNIKELAGRTPQDGEAIFLWTQKSFNAFTFIPYVIKQFGKIDDLKFSSYAINKRILDSLIKWYDKGLIGSVFIFMADSFRYRMPDVCALLDKACEGRNIVVQYSWNHSKIQLIKAQDNYFIIEGSGNFSENAAHEQYLFLNSKQVYEFRSSCFANGG